MDKITGALLGEFTKEFGIAELEENARFERFAAYLTVRRHYSETAFDSADLVVAGGGNDTGIDAIAIIVNNNLITDIDSVNELIEINGYLDASFVFIQAERSSGFDSAKIGQFGYGVKDFFGEGKLKQNEEIRAAVEIMNAIFAQAGKFKKGNPTCYLYYVTTGKWQNDQNLKARADTEVADLTATGNFRAVEFIAVGADQIQKLYSQTKNAIQREFMFPQRTVIQDIANVKEAHLGYMIAKDFLKLVCDENGEIMKNLFYENVRDWTGYNQINGEIRSTLLSANRDRFVLMNNGATIIAKSLQTTGHKFTMGDFQIVNGCQTSHVLRDNADLLTEAVRIPVRIICTADEAVMESIITATNRQTEITVDQFFALKPFAKKLELYFRAFDGDKQLFYERRTHQYDSQDIPKSRIVVHQNLVRATGAMFLGEPHRTTRNYKALSEQVGKNFFSDGDRTEPYYVAAFAAHRLEPLFRNKKLPAIYKAGRYHILLAARLLMDKVPLPQMNANQMAKRCEAMIDQLWNNADDILLAGAEIVDKVATSNWNRDHIRTQPITDGIFAYFGQKKSGAA
jgi:AIPR protein